MTKSDTILRNQTIGQGLAKAPKRKPKNTRSKLPKTHLDYWRSRLEHRTYTENGKRVEVKEWSVRFHHDGIRKSIPLNTSNKDSAADKARTFYLSLKANGWNATLQKFLPPTEHANRGKETTVGEFLQEVERVGTLRETTFNRYAQYFRMIVAHIRGVASNDRQKFNYRTDGLKRWRDRIDATPLSRVTPEAVANWKAAYLAKAGNDPIRKIEINRSFNSAFRNAKSLFSAKIIDQPNFNFSIPRFQIKERQGGAKEVHWHEQIQFEKEGSKRFQLPNGLSYENLLVSARDDLKPHNPEAYQLLLLCLCAGLRRAEADVLLWTQIDPADCSISIESNEFIQPKHDSSGNVDVAQELITELLGFKKTAKGDFVVNSPWEWKRTTYTRYRCTPHWKTLNTWLTSKGVTAKKKIHELRKIFGDAIVKKNGIFAGSSQLRHSSIQMTANHYADRRQRAALPVGTLLSEPSIKPAAESH
jgi:hypothetical protein